MKSELTLFWRQVSMASRFRRRMLVISIYAVIATLTTLAWRIDHWRNTFIFVLMFLILINRYYLGGTYFGGLVKRFEDKGAKQKNGKWHIQQIFDEPELGKDEFHNDEREIHLRDRVHYHSYRIMTGMLAMLSTVIYVEQCYKDWPDWMPMPFDELICVLIFATFLLAGTLPQAILLWTEPDMNKPDMEVSE